MRGREKENIKLFSPYFGASPPNYPASGVSGAFFVIQNDLLNGLVE